MWFPAKTTIPVDTEGRTISVSPYATHGGKGVGGAEAVMVGLIVAGSVNLSLSRRREKKKPLTLLANNRSGLIVSAESSRGISPAPADTVGCVSLSYGRTHVKTFRPRANQNFHLSHLDRGPWATKRQGGLWRVSPLGFSSFAMGL